MPYTPPKKLLDLKNELGKRVGYIVNIHKFKAFVYMKNEISETESREIGFPSLPIQNKDNNKFKNKKITRNARKSNSMTV